mmetsp:Transcript_7647/g.11234  ORF Transcript_7647/g.11234 Transcript_7647/m.11234 type:complete len:369 (-) Transcript_7647:50-1156(-)
MIRKGRNGENGRNGMAITPLMAVMAVTVVCLCCMSIISNSHSIENAMTDCAMLALSTPNNDKNKVDNYDVLLQTKHDLSFPKTCHGKGRAMAASTMTPKVPKAKAIELAQGGFKRIGQGSGKVDLVGAVAMKLSKIQHEFGIFGTVAELGVHHGRFTSCLFITARESEKLVVADIFEQQEKNVDKSGKGNKEAFIRSLSVYGLQISDLHEVYVGSTDELPFDWSERKEFEQFRIISVDAGHTAILTRGDMMLAACNLLEGGIAVLDDTFHSNWFGVTEGMIQYMTTAVEPHQLYPFLYCDGKMFFTNDRTYHTRYYDALMDESLLKPILHTDALKWGGSSEFVMNGVNFLRCKREDVDVKKIWNSLIY